jgi:small-conductance mechanosensitive channel
MRFLSVVFSIVVFAVSGSMATAQMGMPSTSSDSETTITLPDPLTPEAVDALVSRLSDSEVRALLLERLDAQASQITEQEDDGSFLNFASAAATAVVDSVTSAVRVSPLLLSVQTRSFNTFHAELGWAGIGKLFGVLILAMMIGYAVEKLVNAFTQRRFSELLVGNQPDTILETIRFLLLRLGIELLGLLAFFLVTRAIATSILTPDYQVFGQTLTLNLVMFPRLAAALLRLIMAPKQPEFRLLHATDKQAVKMFNYQVAIFFVMGLMAAILAFNMLNDVPTGEARLGFWLNLFIHVFFIFAIWKNWDGLVSIALGSDPQISHFEYRASIYYPYYTIAVVVAAWLMTEVLIGFGRFDLLASAPQFKSIIILTFLPVFDTLIRAIVRLSMPPMTGEGVIAERAYLLTKRSYIRIGRVIMLAIIVTTVAGFWGLTPATIAEAGIGARFAGRFIEVIMIVAVGYLVWELVALWVNRKLAAEQTALGFDLNDEEPGGGEGGGAGGSRLSTVLPLAHSIAKAAIAAIFGLIALGSFGIDTTPLLAGAGILGLAIGFGAQKLVGDIVSGMFFLIDDAFRTGEYVEVEGTMGTVEKISIRSMQLRHHRGLVHTIPFGEIPKLTNFSRDWVIMKLMFTVPFDTDPNKVKKIFKKIGNDMMAEEAWKDDFLQPFKSQGVFGFDDVGMVMRGKFMAKPGKQFMARKEIYNRVKAAFDAAGIDFARREVRVAIPGLENAEDITSEQKTAIEAVATDVAAQEQEKLEQAAKEATKK